MTSYVCKFGPLEIGMGGVGEGQFPSGASRSSGNRGYRARMCAHTRARASSGTRVRVRRLVQKERNTSTRAWNGIYIDHVYWWHTARRERSILVLSKYCSLPPPSTGVYGFLHVHAYFCLYTGGAPLPFKVRRYVQYLFRGFILIGAFRFSSLYAFFQRVVRTRPSFVMDASFIGEDGEEEGKIDEFI